jgi:hypothetical protein
VIPFAFDYATPSAFESTRDRAQLGLAPDERRPVRFHGRVTRDVLSLRLALQTLGELVWSDDSWAGESDAFWLLDPVTTVHPDRVFFEAFSHDRSAYGLVIADRGLFETEAEVRCGTTNVDFTAALWAALAEMRSSRATWLRIEPAGLEVRTEGAGSRFERKVQVPEDWVRAFLQLQGAMAMPGTRLRVRAVDLLAAIRFLRYTKAKVSPRALRYEMEPGQDARVVLEPWEKAFVLRGADHTYAEPRSVRTWGRRRLKLIEPLLPYADAVEIYLKGRAQPSFYAVELPGVTFVLGLSGWTENQWTAAGGHGSPAATARPDLLERAVAALRDRALDESALAARLGVPRAEAVALLVRLCRLGRALYDVRRREYRHRELFATPIDEERFYPVDPREEEARAFVAANDVHIASAAPRLTARVKRLKTPEGPVTREVVHRDWTVTGAVASERAVEIVLDDGGRLTFGRCGCPFFAENLLNRGPCAHLLALLAASEDLRKDQPSSRPAAAPPREEAVRDENDDDASGEDADE